MKAPISTQTAKSGFTLIEISIAMAFISMLMISIAIITTNIITIYQKGLTLKAVNNVGRSLVDEFTSAINSAPSVDTTSLCNRHLSNVNDIQSCIDNNAYRFVFQERTATNKIPGSTANDEWNTTIQTGGVFCTGKYSYVWNTKYIDRDPEAKLAIRYQYYNPDTRRVETTTLEDFRLVRFSDPTYRTCSTLVSKENYTEDRLAKTNIIDITKLSTGADNVITMLADQFFEQNFLHSFDTDLELYEFTIFPIAQDVVTLRTFMTGTFILATKRGNVNIMRAGEYCDIENRLDEETASSLSDLGSEFNYCAINKFNFAARTAGM